MAAVRAVSLLFVLVHCSCPLLCCMFMEQIKIDRFDRALRWRHLSLCVTFSDGAGRVDLRGNTGVVDRIVLPVALLMYVTTVADG